MKHLIKLSLLLLVFLLPATAIAHDFEVDGIYYNILNDNEVEVTYRGSNYYSFDEYSGDVSIPSTVTYDGITYSVTSIGSYAFYGCYSLASITIPNTVTSIGELAFNWCSSLSSIDIPSSVTSIGKRAFSNCAALTSITVASNNQTYDSRENCNAVIETATNTLVVGSSNTVIPNSVTSIGDCAFFECRGLTSITIPNSVISIENNAFYFCI